MLQRNFIFIMWCYAHFGHCFLNRKLFIMSLFLLCYYNRRYLIKFCILVIHHVAVCLYINFMYCRSVECLDPCEDIALWIDEQCSTDHVKLSENCLGLIFASIFENWSVTIFQVCSVSRATWRYSSLWVHKSVPLTMYCTLTSQWTTQFWIWVLPCIYYLLKMRYYLLTSVTSKNILKEKSGQSFSH